MKIENKIVENKINNNILSLRTNECKQEKKQNKINCDKNKL